MTVNASGGDRIPIRAGLLARIIAQQSLSGSSNSATTSGTNSGRRKGGTRTYRWVLEQFLAFLKGQEIQCAGLHASPSTMAKGESMRYGDARGAADPAASSVDAVQRYLSPPTEGRSGSHWAGRRRWVAAPR